MSLVGVSGMAKEDRYTFQRERALAIRWGRRHLWLWGWGGHLPSSCRSASIDIAICAQCHVEMEPAMPATRVGGGGVDGGEMKLMFSCVGEDIVVDRSVMWVMAVEGRREESG